MTTIWFSVFVFIFSMQTAYADCRDQYQSSLRSEKTKTAFQLNPTALSSTSYGAAILIPIAISQLDGSSDWFSSSQPGSLEVSYGTGFAFLVGGGIMLIHKDEGTKDQQAYQLIKEAYIGSGNELSSTTEFLSRVTSTDLSEKLVATTIIEANTDKVFCDRHLWEYDKIKKFLIKEFQH